MAQQKTTTRDRAQAAAEQRKALADAALPPGTTAGELDLHNGGVDGATGEVVKTDPLRDLLDRFEPEITKQFPVQLRINPKPWMRMVLTGMRTSKQAAQLAKCDRPSLFAALLEAARFGLTPFTDEAAIVPYGTTATFIPMAQGFVRMFWNTGQIRGVVVDFIRKNEVRGRDWQVSRGSAGEGFWHNPRFFDEETGEPVEPGEPVIAYCYLRFRDGTASEPALVTRWDAEDVMRTKSRAWQNAENLWENTNGRKGRDSLWHTNFNAMWLKTAVRRAAKYGPKSAELQELLLIEAREDRTRPDAPRPAPPPPMGEGAGIDWSTDIAGGKVVAGDVVGREDEDGQAPFPGGAQPAPPPEGTQAEGTREPAGAEHAAAPGTPASAAGEALAKDTPPPPADPDAPASGRTIKRLTDRLGRVTGLRGQQAEERRLIVVGALVTGHWHPLGSLADLTEAQVETAIGNYDKLADAAQQRKEPLADVMKRLVASAVEQRDKARAAQQQPEGAAGQ
jgi:recombination protein RecT